MKSRKLLISVMVGVGLSGLLLAVYWRDSDADRQRSSPAVASVVREGKVSRPPLALGELYAEGVAKARPGEAAEALTPRSVSSLDSAIEEVLDADPQLRKFYELKRKALRSSAEQQDYLDMISDEKLIAEARRDLLTVSSSADFDQLEELRRLQRIQFLNSALSWQDNPKRSMVMSAVTEVLLAEIPAEASKSVKGSMLGDKLDLFQILMLIDRAQAEALLAKGRGTALEQVFQLAWSTGASGQRTNTR